jgi:TonB-dependent starch-binding outer membrane protein SusC
MERKTLHIYEDLRKCPRSFRLLLLVFLVGCFSSAQAQLTVSGKITDESGNDMPGVNIILKGTSNGTTSNANGAYTLAVPDANSVLVFTFIGYNAQEQVVGSRTTIDVALTPNILELSEVVVVGYGTQLKRDITGAIVKINSDALLLTPSANAIDQLKGQAAGVNITSASSVPGGGSQIRIRGSRTMVANSPVSGTSASNDAATADQADAPLLVVDGIPYNGNLNDISPNDIASMEILKDASATAIYGSRGAGGVILISTKRGTQGKTVFSYDAYYGISKVMKELRVFNGEEYAKFKEEAAAGNSVTPNANGYALTQAEKDALAAGVSTDWQKLIYEDAPITNHNLSVSGGSDKSKYSLSAGYFRQGGIIPNQDYSRYTVRSTMDHQLNKRIKVGMNTINTLSYQNTPGGSAVPVGLMRLTPLASPYNPDGSVNLLPQAGQTDGSAINPLTLITKSSAILARNRRLRTFNSFYGEVDLIKGLKYRANVGLDFYQDKIDNYSGPGTYVNTALQQSQSQANVRNTENYQYTIENLLIYEKTFKEKHKLGFTGLYSFQKNHTQSHYLAAIGVPFDYMQNSNFYPAASVNTGTKDDNYFNERGLTSLMARATYSYEGRYSLTATVRRDGSSVLSKGNQYFTYPAFGAAWNITNEQFMSNVSIISNLKLRAGWGVTASQGINPYSTLGGLNVSAYNFGKGTSGQQVGTVVTSLPNPDLKWQSTNQYNFGLDFGIFSNRITGAVEFYKQKTSDILLPVSLPPSNGASSTYLNLGKTEAHGLEVTISSTNVQTANGLVWSTDFNYFFNREKIVQLTTPTENSNIGNGWFVGQPLTVIYDYKKVGIWQTEDDFTTQTSPAQKPGQIKVLDWNTANAKPGTLDYGKPDGKITPDDRMVLGNFQPKFEAGMTNRVSFKRFDFSISVYARMGMKVVVPYVSSEPGGANYTGYNFFNQSRQNQLKVDYWTPTNPTNAFPRPDAGLGAPLYSSTLSYVDGSFIKCRSINLGYDIPSAVLGKVGVSSLRVYVSAVNPFVIWSPFVKDGYGPDPEGNGYGGAVNSSGTSNAGTAGRQVTVNANNPATRQFLVGLNLKF